MSRTSLTCWALWWYSYTRETSGSHHLKKNVHLSSLLSPWWTALVSLRESFSSYPEEPLTYNVFVYWLFKKKKREEKKKLQAPSRFLNIVQPTNWILRHSSVAFFKNLSCNETFFVLRLTWEHTLFVFFVCLFVCLLFKLQNTIVRRWDIFKCEIQWSRSTM